MPNHTIALRSLGRQEQPDPLQSTLEQRWNALSPSEQEAMALAFAENFVVEKIRDDLLNLNFRPTKDERDAVGLALTMAWEIYRDFRLSAASNSDDAGDELAAMERPDRFDPI